MTDDYQYRFGGIGRLFGTNALAVLQRAHVCVIGVGGVGSWAVEALARSGIGELTVIDWDDICVTNVNRQLHAVDGEIGRAKVEALADRVKAINAGCIFHERQEFFSEESAERILETPYDYVLDAIDSFKPKCLLIAMCRRRRIPVITVGGAGGRVDPTAVQVNDLSRSYDDPLLAQVRKKLRQKFGFPRESRHRFRVECVFSAEAILYPQPDGTVGHQRTTGSKMKLDCESGYGNASFVTGAFGFAAASRIVRRLVARAEAKK